MRHINFSTNENIYTVWSRLFFGKPENEIDTNFTVIVDSLVQSRRVILIAGRKDKFELQSDYKYVIQKCL